MVLPILICPASALLSGVQVTSHKQKLRQSVARGEVPGARRIGVTYHYAGRRSRREVKRRPKRYCTPLDEGICYENFGSSALIAFLQRKKYYENLCRGSRQGNDFTMKKPGTLIRPGFYVGLGVASVSRFSFFHPSCNGKSSGYQNNYSDSNDNQLDDLRDVFHDYFLLLRFKVFFL
ncbi:hypothetical protein [uncultured Victivallis sp.]|uniref:hypothetical protein n=1 Tax=uncultured Victivallis sp. TaxID=354118 RepID=UPI002597A5E9|nr:hypothetical protein [uncultured Victivallis sp.]